MFKLPIDQLSHYRLRTLYNKGFRPHTILDIGAYRGSWTEEVKRIFPEANFFMIEGNPECEPYLQKTGHLYHIGMLSDHPKMATYYSHNGQDKSGNSLYREQTDAYDDEQCTQKTVICTTLNSVARTRRLTNVDFIKLDVQGSEKDVMNGGLDVVKGAQVVLLELQLVEYNKGAPILADMIAYMDRLGFQMFDITELHYTPNHTLLRIDVLFGRKDVTDLVKHYQ